jgi:polyisoprenoid-binding protein YceI
VAEGTIDRTDYDVSYGAGAIGNEIPVRVDLELVKTD